MVMVMVNQGHQSQKNSKLRSPFLITSFKMITNQDFRRLS